MRVDVHQHLLTEPLTEALEHRVRLPFIRRHGSLCTVFTTGEAPFLVDVAGEEPDHRRTLVQRDRLDYALIAISGTLGIEALPRVEARHLIDAHLEGVLALGEPFGAWGPLALDGLCPASVERIVERGCIGASLPAGALVPPCAPDRLFPVLGLLQQLDMPLFIHPGPAPGSHPAEPSLSDPLWWPALTSTVGQMQAAWLSFVTAVRPAHPRLRVVFALLAGGAPLLSERLRARGGPEVSVADQFSFYDSSSYGPGAIDAMSAVVGPAQLLYGSGRPVIEPSAGERAERLSQNGAWLVQRVNVRA